MRHVAAAFVALLAAVPAFAAELSIGVIHAQSGPYAFVGTSVVNGIRLAEEEIRARNLLGADSIKLLVEDNGSDRSQAVGLLSRLATRDRALVVLGPSASPEALAAAPVANDLKIPMMTTAVTAEVLAAGPWSFKVTESPEGFIRSLARFGTEKLNVKRCALVFIRENDGAIRQKNTFRDELRAHGLDVVSEEAILASDVDFTALSTKLVASGADCIFLASTAEQSANLILQARQAGLAPSVRFLITSSAASQQFINAGGRAVEEAYLVADFVPGGMNEQGRTFVDSYQRRFGRPPDNWAAVGYTKMMVVAQAIRTAQPSPSREAVRAALGQVRHLPVVLGEGTFSLDENRIPNYGGAILVVRNGQFTAP